VRTPLHNWKIYLDTCCLSRLFDPLTQARVRQEAEAISQILTHCSRGSWNWVSSTILSDEIEQTPDLIKRSRIEALLPRADQIISVGTDVRTRGKNLESLRFQKSDALHIACAEIGKVDIFLTTDDKLLRRAKRYHTQLHIRVENPSTWLQEVNSSQ
jgi:predicted nucleic acid-binding protein